MSTYTPSDYAGYSKCVTDEIFRITEDESQLSYTQPYKNMWTETGRPMKVPLDRLMLHDTIKDSCEPWAKVACDLGLSAATAAKLITAHACIAKTCAVLRSEGAYKWKSKASGYGRDRREKYAQLDDVIMKAYEYSDDSAWSLACTAVSLGSYYQDSDKELGFPEWLMKQAESANDTTVNPRNGSDTLPEDLGFDSASSS